MNTQDIWKFTDRTTLEKIYHRPTGGWKLRLGPYDGGYPRFIGTIEGDKFAERLIACWELCQDIPIEKLTGLREPLLKIFHAHMVAEQGASESEGHIK